MVRNLLMFSIDTLSPKVTQQRISCNGAPSFTIMAHDNDTITEHLNQLILYLY